MPFTLSEIIDSARGRIGNKEDIIAAGQFVSDDEVAEELRDYVVECTRVFGTGSDRKEVTFTTTPNVQNYPITTVGTDVRQIVDVIRSDSYIGDNYLQPSMVDPITGNPVRQGAFIDQGYQQDAFDVMVGIQRALRQEKYAWERVNVSGVDTLRLMPPPNELVNVTVTYISTGESVDDLPDAAREAMSNAACAAFLDCMLNRTNSNPAVLNSGLDTRDLRVWLESWQKQRDRYLERYQKSLLSASQN